MVTMDMQSDHGKTEEYIHRIDELTGQYLYMAEDPELVRIYREMQSLFADISIHIGKEDHSLWAEFSYFSKLSIILAPLSFIPRLIHSMIQP